MTDLSIEEVEGIVRFLGYGRPSAPVWFIGLEEGLGKMNSEDDRKNLKARASFETNGSRRLAQGYPSRRVVRTCSFHFLETAGLATT
jgi:hypothetical protein